MQSDDDCRTSLFLLVASAFLLVHSDFVLFSLPYSFHGLQPQARRFVAAERHSNTARLGKAFVTCRLHEILLRRVPRNRSHSGRDCGRLVDCSGVANISAQAGPGDCLSTLSGAGDCGDYEVQSAVPGTGAEIARRRLRRYCGHCWNYGREGRRVTRHSRNAAGNRRGALAHYSAAEVASVLRRVGQTSDRIATMGGRTRGSCRWGVCGNTGSADFVRRCRGRKPGCDHCRVVWCRRPSTA